MAPFFFGMQAELDSVETLPTVSQARILEDPLENIRSLYFERLNAQQEGIDLQDDPKLVQEVMERARRVVAHPSNPSVLKSAPLLEYPFEELDIEASLDENWDLSVPENLLVQIREPRAFQCVAMLDCSSSMSGDKHLTASIAVAVLLLKVAARDAGLVVFHSNSQLVKSVSEEQSAEATVLKFLKVRPKGFTNIALGLEEGLKNLRQRGARKRIGLLASDGRSTQGKDPVAVAKQFDCLIVLHLHGPGSHLEASQKMAIEGKGICLEVDQFEDLPRRMYDALRMLSHR